VYEAILEIHLEKPETVNAVLLQEYIPLGQRVRSFTIQAMSHGKYSEVAGGTTVGNSRIVRFANIVTEKIQISIFAKACPLISNVEIYRIPE
jgi:alpha-L-fucosidase